jgi:hypothetical protein
MHGDNWKDLPRGARAKRLLLSLGNVGSGTVPRGDLVALLRLESALLMISGGIWRAEQVIQKLSRKTAGLSKNRNDTVGHETDKRLLSEAENKDKLALTGATSKDLASELVSDSKARVRLLAFLTDRADSHKGKGKRDATWDSKSNLVWAIVRYVDCIAHEPLLYLYRYLQAFETKHHQDQLHATFHKELHARFGVDLDTLMTILSGHLHQVDRTHPQPIRRKTDRATNRVLFKAAVNHASFLHNEASDKENDRRTMLSGLQHAKGSMEVVYDIFMGPFLRQNLMSFFSPHSVWHDFIMQYFASIVLSIPRTKLFNLMSRAVGTWHPQNKNEMLFDI